MFRQREYTYSLPERSSIQRQRRRMFSLPNESISPLPRATNRYRYVSSQRQNSMPERQRQLQSHHAFSLPNIRIRSSPHVHSSSPSHHSTWSNRSNRSRKNTTRQIRQRRRTQSLSPQHQSFVNFVDQWKLEGQIRTGLLRISEDRFPSAFKDLKLGKRKQWLREQYLSRLSDF